MLLSTYELENIELSMCLEPGLENPEENAPLIPGRDMEGLVEMGESHSLPEYIAEVLLW